MIWLAPRRKNNTSVQRLRISISSLKTACRGTKGVSPGVHSSPPPPPPPEKKNNTTHRGRFQVNVNHIRSATPNKMVPAIIDLSPGVVLLPRQILSLSLFVSCPTGILKLEELSSCEAPSNSKATKPRTIDGIFAAENIITAMSNLAVKAPVRLLWKTSRRSFQTSSLSEKFGLWKSL